MKKHFNFILAMAIALATFFGARALAQPLTPNLSITDQNPHPGIVLPLNYVAKCYPYPPGLTGALHPDGDYVIYVNAFGTSPEIAMHIYDLTPGNVVVFAALDFACDTIYDTTYAVTPLSGELHFYVKTAQTGYLAVLSTSMLDTVTLQVSATDPIVTYPLPFLCGDVVTVGDPEGEKPKNRWRRIDINGWTIERQYFTEPLQPGLYANQYGRKILVQ